MNIRLLLLLVLGLATTTLLADSPARPIPYVATSAEGGSRFYFRMSPDLRDPSNETKASGVAYEIQPNGKDKVLWRTSGWYSFNVFLSWNAEYLAALGPWNEGREPKKEDVAITFFRNGKLLKQYSTVDLVRDLSKVRVTASHYDWLAWHILPVGLDAVPRVMIDTFYLKTCDGIVYEFDMTTGAIISASK